MLTHSQLHLRGSKLPYEGWLQVQVINTEMNSLIKQIELPDTEDDAHILLRWLSDYQWLAVTSLGKIFISDKDQETCQLLLDLQTYSDPGCWFDTSSQLLWLAGWSRRNGKKTTLLYCINPTTGEIIHEWDFPKNISVDCDTMMHNGKRLIWYGRNDKPGYKFRQHWIQSFSIQQKTWEQFFIASKPSPESVPVRPQLFCDYERGQFLMPFCDQVLNPTLDQYSYQLQKINADGSINWQQTVRQFSCQQLSADAETQQALQQLASGDLSYQHNDAWMNLLQALTGVYFCPQQSTIWLGWQDGMIQQLASDGSLLSPLYQLQRADGRALYGFSDTIYRVVEVTREAITISVGEDGDETYWQANLAQLSADNPIDTAVEIPLVCTPFEVEPIKIRAEQQLISLKTGRVQLVTSDLESNTGQQYVLEQLLTLMPTLQAQLQSVVPKKQGLLHKWLHGNTNTSRQKQPLYFAFSDALGKEQREYDFFHRLNRQHAALIAAIIEKFVHWPNAAQLIRPQKGEPVLSEAVLSICDDVQYLPLLSRYFNVIGGGEQVHPFHINRTLPVIRDEHSKTQALTDFLASVPWPYNDSTFTLKEHDEYDDWGNDD